MMRKLLRVLRRYFPIAVLGLVIAPPAWAAPPQLVTGAQNLLNDVLTWLLWLIPAAAGAAIAYHALVKQLSDGDPSTIASHNRAMKNVLIGAAIGWSASGLVKWFLSYF